MTGSPATLAGPACGPLPSPLSNPLPGPRRGALRQLASAAAVSASGLLAGCDRLGLGQGKLVGGRFSKNSVAGQITGGFVGASFERGHRLRIGDRRNDETGASASASAGQNRRVRVAIIGAGISGLSAARALRAAGIDDYRLFELEDEAGGNSRSGFVGGLPCPWGAHYLPVPDEDNHALRELLLEAGALRYSDGKQSFDETMLCHALQERLLVDGRWLPSLLPPASMDPGTSDDYRRFAGLIAAERASGRYRLPSDPGQAGSALQTFDQQTFASWLVSHKLNSTPLRWYLDYCCRDDYGAGINEVSAWAGIHYFASRHGFFAPSSPGGDLEDRSELLTWAQGNGWLVEKMLAPHREQLMTGVVVQQVEELPSGGVEIELWNTRDSRIEHWLADFVILAVPLFVAARLMPRPPAALSSIVTGLRYASWQVANLYLPSAPAERAGAPRAWDNVIYGSQSLGYVDATHQSLSGSPGPAVFTCYNAGGLTSAARQALYDADWKRSVERLFAELEPAHADIRKRVSHVDIMRWGHAMVVPVPGLRSNPALAQLRQAQGRVSFAHSDLSGYSVFEEAFFNGLRAGRQAACEVSGVGASRC